MKFPCGCPLISKITSPLGTWLKCISNHIRVGPPMRPTEVFASGEELPCNAHLIGAHLFTSTTPAAPAHSIQKEKLEQKRKCEGEETISSSPLSYPPHIPFCFIIHLFEPREQRKSMAKAMAGSPSNEGLKYGYIWYTSSRIRSWASYDTQRQLRVQS